MERKLSYPLEINPIDIYLIENWQFMIKIVSCCYIHRFKRGNGLVTISHFQKVDTMEREE